jgi:hypothetical protein
MSSFPAADCDAPFPSCVLSAVSEVAAAPMVLFVEAFVAAPLASGSISMVA